MKRYRAWNHYRGKMYKVYGVEKGVYDEMLVVTEEGYFKAVRGNESEELRYVTVMESTGIFDEEGREIYQSDVVKYVGRYGEVEIGKIVKEGKNFYFKSVENKYQVKESLNDIKYGIKILGTIYTNWRHLQ